MERFWFNTGEDIKRMSGDGVGEARDYSNAVPGIRGVIQLYIASYLKGLSPLQN
jgi:hypothetical protein